MLFEQVLTVLKACMEDQSDALHRSQFYAHLSRLIHVTTTSSTSRDRPALVEWSRQLRQQVDTWIVERMKTSLKGASTEGRDPFIARLVAFVDFVCLRKERSSGSQAAGKSRPRVSQSYAYSHTIQCLGLASY